MTAARVKFFDEASAFASAVMPSVATRAIANNVFIGIVERMVHAPNADHLRAAVWANDGLALAALRTPPNFLYLVHAGHGFNGVGMLAEALHARRDAIPGVSGEEHLAAAFAAAWGEQTGLAVEATDRRLLYQATSVVRPSAISGDLVLAERANFERHIAWELAFAADVEAREAERDPVFIAERIERWFSRGALFDWRIDGAAVAQGVVWPIGADGARVMGIYTPPAMRGRGYAQAMTAALTQHVLNQGRWCTLFTDAANPITNKIYPRVGYRFVAAYADLTFAE
jgi:predicted GNAT family acetyltransferase